MWRQDDQVALVRWVTLSVEAPERFPNAARFLWVEVSWRQPIDQVSWSGGLLYPPKKCVNTTNNCFIWNSWRYSVLPSHCSIANTFCCFLHTPLVSKCLKVFQLCNVKGFFPRLQKRGQQIWSLKFKISILPRYTDPRAPLHENNLYPAVPQNSIHPEKPNTTPIFLFAKNQNKHILNSIQTRF